jgi:hypothetical protein
MPPKKIKIGRLKVLATPFSGYARGFEFEETPRQRNTKATSEPARAHIDGPSCTQTAHTCV